MLTLEPLPSVSASEGASLLDGTISQGDHVVLSTEDGRYGVMTGFVVELTSSRVTIDLRGPFSLPPVLRDGAHSDTYHALVDLEGWWGGG